MADESDAERINDTDDEGGPVKSFLEHLEDLRWVLIKSLATVGVAFVICLVAGDWVVSFLTYPLQHAKVSYPKGTQAVSVEFGTNRLGVFQIPPEQQKTFSFGTNKIVSLHLRPVTVGTNLLLGLEVGEGSPETERLSIPLVSLSPAGAFIVAVQVAAYAGIIISAPFILFFISQFVFPALRMNEKKYIYRGLFFGVGLFTTGILFCYFVLMPIALTASVKYTQWLGFSVPQWRAEDYISFVSKFMLGMGLGFELPVILLVLVKIGVLTHSSLVKARRYVIVLNFFLGAVLTTPEIVTQVLMALPLQVLYEISLWIAWYWEHPNPSQARRKLLSAFLIIVAIGVGLWLAYKYGMPLVTGAN